MRESDEDAAVRWEKLRLLQGHYRHFTTFLEAAMGELGFALSDIQEDIGLFMELEPGDIMVQAQRSQAKTTIAACFGVWSLIHAPHYRIIVVCAAGTLASDISTLMVRLVLNMPELSCLCPDRNAGDRGSTEAFDVHHSLKGIDKSPSISCMGIDSNVQGKRGDILLADDVESTKNSATAVQREKLLHLTKDFASIVQHGRTIWLGTPQSRESIYNALPGRGVKVRIWPGRYPTITQLTHYGAFLAPLIQRRIKADPALCSGGGVLQDQGKPLDPVLLDEEALQKKERTQGKAYFQLQHMLNTALSDEDRFPLKASNLIYVSNVSPVGVPTQLVRGMDAAYLTPIMANGKAYHLMRPQQMGAGIERAGFGLVTIDPAGGGANGDETGMAAGYSVAGNIHVPWVGGFPGGYELHKLHLIRDTLVELVRKGFPLRKIIIEKNFGYGAFQAVLEPVIRAIEKELGPVGIDEDYVSGQKERRIIDTLEPVVSRGSLIIHDTAVAANNLTLEYHSPEKRGTYCVFHQLAGISSVRDALVHDDRLDALEALVRHLQPQLSDKDSKRDDQEHLRRLLAAVRPPGGRPPSRARSILDRYRRK